MPGMDTWQFGISLLNYTASTIRKGLPAYKDLGEIPRGARFPVEPDPWRSWLSGTTECSTNKPETRWVGTRISKPLSANLVVRSDDSVRVIAGDDEKLQSGNESRLWLLRSKLVRSG